MIDHSAAKPTGHLSAPVHHQEVDIEATGHLHEEAVHLLRMLTHMRLPLAALGVAHCAVAQGVRLSGVGMM